MPKSSLYGMPARYLATPPTLIDGDETPLMVDINGRLIINALGSIATGQVYTTSNVITTRTFNASLATPFDTANVLGTLINDLKSIGILS